MADNKVTEEQAAELLTILHSDIILDKKVQYVNNIKSGIKQHNVPETCVPLLFDGLRAAASSQHNAIVNVGFTALNHLLTRLSRQEPKLLNKEAARTLPLIIEKLGDQKDKYRATAMQALNTLYSVHPGDVERFIRNSAMTGKNPRAKESAMQWLLQTHQEQGLQFRSYVPLLMDLLEDADGMVRDVAKSTVIELFRNAPNTAKSDLKRQLKNFKVRPAIEQAIVKELAPTGARPETPANVAPAARPVLAASVSSMSSERPITPAVDTRAENIEPQYVNTNRELDDIFKGMAWFFEGRESEQNWIKREESMVTLRRLNAGNATSDFPDTFLAGLRGMLDGIIKAVTSLRTSLSKEGCGLVQDIAVAFGPAMDPMVELLMQTFVKLSAGTKKISSQLANTTVDTILSNVTYSQRLMQHIWIAFQDKNVAPRTYATGWLKTMLKKEANHKSHVEHTGGVDLIEKCIKKGLGDPNPAVREKTRSVFWAFWGIWPQRADVIMEDLEATAQKLLNKDPSNPNAPKKEDAPARPGLGLSRSTMTASKPSLRETMMAQKKATLAAKGLPARPGSAMAHISHARKVSDPKPPSGASSSKPSGSRARPEAGTVSVNASSMSVAPVRPTRKRPEVAPRPATAGPYSVRDRGEHIEAESPRTLKAKVAPKPKETTPRRTAQRTRPGHASHASESSITSPVARPRSVASNRVSPTRLKNTQSALLSSSPAAKLNEDLTLVVPQIPHPQATTAQQANKLEEELVKPHVEALPETPVEAPVQIHSPSDETPQPVKVYEDPFIENQQEPKPVFTGSVLEDKPVNEDAANLPHSNGQAKEADDADSLDKANKNARLLDSGISKIKLKSLEVHGFRKLQSLLRDSKTAFTDDKFQALLLGLFQFLEDPLSTMPSDKAQDVKAQVLTTIKLLLKRERDNFKPHVSKCLESLLETRSRYEGRAHIISGLELLADELVTLGDPPEIVVVLGRKLQGWDDSTPEGCRALSTGLHVLKAMLEKQEEVVLSDSELALLVELTRRCLESTDSGVRMDAVQLCVALHASAGEERFWDSLKDIKEDPKSLITYYIIKRQRESGGVSLA